LARGQFVAFLDDDDYFAPEGLGTLLTHASTSGVAVAFGNYATFDTAVLTEYSLAGISTDDMLVCNRIPVGAYLINRASISRRFDERLRSHEDWDFLLSLVLDGGSAHVPKLVALIDKTENENSSMQARRRGYFWLDFLSVYTRFPAAHLATQRSGMLQSMGIGISDALLRFSDEI
jgi:glycosyltransferase involved in cell wall biosynthesis